MATRDSRPTIPTPSQTGEEAGWLRDQGFGTGGLEETGELARDLAAGKVTREQVAAERAGFILLGQGDGKTPSK